MIIRLAPRTWLPRPTPRLHPCRRRGVTRLGVARSDTPPRRRKGSCPSSAAATSRAALENAGGDAPACAPASAGGSSAASSFTATHERALTQASGAGSSADDIDDRKRTRKSDTLPRCIACAELAQ
jgi:hypothetical protein